MSRRALPRSDEPIRLAPVADGYHYRVVLDVAPKGSPRRQLTRTFKTLIAARDFVSDTRHALRRHTGVQSSETVEQLCTRWLQGRPDIRPVTQEHYRHMLRPVIARIGSIPIQHLGVSDVETLVGDLTSEGGRRGQGLGPRSVKGVLVLLRKRSI